jgi:hypothetical protein
MTLATAVWLALVAGRLQGDDPPKSSPADVGPGRVAWFDITTSTLPRSQESYGELFGWGFTPLPGTD